MATSDDEIPDLFPGAPLKEPVRNLPDARSARVPEPAPPSFTPRAAAPTRVRPSSYPPAAERYAAGTGLELEDLNEDDSVVAVSRGKADELEFDPLFVKESAPPLSFKEQDASLESPPLSGPRSDSFALDLAPVPALAPPGGARARPEPLSPGALAGPARVKAAASTQAAGSVQATAPRQSGAARQSGAPRQSAPARAAPPAQEISLSNFPGMAGEVDLGEGFDDFEMGGAALAQQNVVVPEREPEEDVPWPTGITPIGDELAVSPEEALLASGFGPAPAQALGAPAYALRVFLARRELQEKERLAKVRLAEAERARDERLAQLAEAKRKALEGSDRFTGLFDLVVRHEEEIAKKRRALEMADVEGAQALRDVQAKFDQLSAERLVKERARDEQGAVLEKAALGVARARATLKRIDIQWRNIEARAQSIPGKEMPDDLSRLLDDLEEQKKATLSELSSLQEQKKETERLFEAVENEVRLVTAALLRTEGEKEGLLMAYEGDIARHSKELDESLLARQTELAAVARALLDLRGEVPVSGAVRLDLGKRDEEVKKAALELSVLMHAFGAVDEGALRKGQVIGIGGALAILVGLLLLLIL